MKWILMILLFPSAAMSWQNTYPFKFKNIEYSVSLEYDDEYIQKCVDQVEDWNERYGAYSDSYDLNISKYVQDAPCKRIVKDLHAKLEAEYRKISSPELWDDINFRIAFVGSVIKYTKDEETHKQMEFYQTPFETVYTRKGDCEDSSFLLSMLFSLQGYNSILIQTVDHQAVCVDPFTSVWKNVKTKEIAEVVKDFDAVEFSDRDYYFCESTGPKNDNCYVMGKRPKFTEGYVRLIEFVGLYSEKDDWEVKQEMMELKKQLRENGGIPMLIGNK